jgi:hypothetical protein
MTTYAGHAALGGQEGLISSSSRPANLPVHHDAAEPPGESLT